jgi:methylated-DNA-[protein]-cysteine S-methyltransferase
MKRKRSSHNEFVDVFDSPLGRLFLIFNSAVLTGVSFKKPQGMLLKSTDVSLRLKRELSHYFDQGKTSFACKTDFAEGTDFERKVWKTLKDVPYGETRSYKWIADRIGAPRASRAVGKALSKNPLPIVFPCHRIIESDGSIGGYSSGIDIKRRLLDLEYYTKMSRSQ